MALVQAGATGRLGGSEDGTTSPQRLGVTMAVSVTRNAGMLVLAIYLIVIGVVGLVPVPIPLGITAALALVAGVLILLGR
jgi:hypothetical protein